jgi:hypothetical protein
MAVGRLAHPLPLLHNYWGVALLLPVASFVDTNFCWRSPGKA